MTTWLMRAAWQVTRGSWARLELELDVVGPRMSLDDRRGRLDPRVQVGFMDLAFVKPREEAQVAHDPANAFQALRRPPQQVGKGRQGFVHLQVPADRGDPAGHLGWADETAVPADS